MSTKDSNGQVTACVELTLLRVSSPALGSLTADWVRYCITNFIGYIYVPDRVFFKLAVTVHHRCLNGRAPPYLSDCVPAAGVDTRQHLLSANRQLEYLATGSTLTAVGPFHLPAHSLELSPGFHPGPDISADSFRRLLKTYLFDTSAFSALELLDDNCALQIYLLTYQMLYKPSSKTAKTTTNAKL